MHLHPFMKKSIRRFAYAVFGLSLLSQNAAFGFSEPRLTAELGFSVMVVGDSVQAQWKPWEGDFMWYKLVRSAADPAPTYPEAAAIFSSTDRSISSFVDTDPIKGKSYYRVCVFTYQSERICSKSAVVTFPASEADAGETLLLTNSMTTAAAEVVLQTPFRDVDTGTEAGKAIEYFAETGVIRGFGDNEFRPHQGITRAELAKVVVLAVGFETEPGNTRDFCDVHRDDWFFPYVEALVSRDYVSGYQGGDCPYDRKFRPHHQITRGEATKIILESFGIGGSQQAADEMFVDVARTHWFAPYADSLLRRDFVTRAEMEYFRPDAPITRAEVMVLLKRIADASRTPVDEEIPRIIDHFACSDYCPGSQAQYWVRIYEGVENPDECKILGGKTLVYYQLGGSAAVCLADPEDDPLTPMVACDEQNPCARGEECVLTQTSGLPRCTSRDPCQRCGNDECVIIKSKPVENAPLRVICKD